MSFLALMCGEEVSEWSGVRNVYVMREYSWVLPVNAVAKEAVCGVGSSVL